MYNNLSRKTKMLWPKKILSKKQLFDLEVKSQGPTKVITVRNTPPYGHAPTHQISLTYLERQKCYGPDKKILFNFFLFDLEVKGQGPTKVITVCDTPPYGHAPTYQISLTYLERNNYLTLRSKVKIQGRSLQYVTHRLMVMHPHTKYHWPISKDKNVMTQTRKYYLKNNYLNLRSKVKVPRRSLWYVTNCLMVMHPHTKYHWPISKDKNVMAWTRKYYSKNNYLTLRSKSNKGHYGMRHTALWSCTHIPNIIDLSRKKQLFDIEVKGQGPTKVIMVRDTPPYGHAPTYQISLTYLKRNNYLTLRLKVKVPQRSLWYVTHRHMVMHPHTK